MCIRDSFYIESPSGGLMLTPTDWTGLDHYLGDFVKLLDQVDRKQVQTMVDLVEECYVKEKTVFIIGNGGSGANASHLCEDLGKGTLHDFDTVSYTHLRAHE